MDREPQTTARERRTTGKAAFARFLREILHVHQVDQDVAADALGVGESIVQRWCDATRPETPSIVDVANLRHLARGGREVARAILERLAGELGLEVHERSDEQDGTDHQLRQTTRLHSEAAEAVQALLMLVARRGPGERTQAIKELTDLHRLTGDLLARLARQDAGAEVVSIRTSDPKAVR